MAPVSERPVDGPDDDRGLAAERTQLAWNRSGLAVLAAVAIVSRRLWPIRGTTGSVVVIVTAFGGLTWALGMFLTRRASGRPAGFQPVHARALTAGTVLLAGAGVALALTTPH